MDHEDLNQARIDLARRIFASAEGLTGGEVCQGMDQALAAADRKELDDVRDEHFPSDDSSGEEGGEA